MAEDEKKPENADGAPDGEAPAEAPLSEAEQAIADEAEKSKKKSFRLFLGLAIATLVSLTWLIYAMRYEAKPQKEDTSHFQNTEPTEGPEEEPEGVEALSEAIPIEPFLVNVVARHRGKARLGQKVLRVRFEVVPESEETIKSLEKFMPKIRDSVNILLSSQDYGDLAMSEGREALRSLIKDQINEVIQPDRIQTVYFIEFVIN